MRTKGDGRSVLGAICLVLFLVLGIGEAAGATYYASPSGTNTTTCSSGDPCSLATGLKKLAAGDTLVLKNGTYYSGINVPISGASGNRITIKAENDGQAIVDGEGVREPLRISSQSYITVQGIVFKNGVYDVVRIGGSASFNELKRLSIVNAGNGNYHLLLFTGTANNNLVEDCLLTQGSLSGNGRHGIIFFAGPHDNTARRHYIKWYKHNGGGGDGSAALTAYGSEDNNLFENNVVDLTEGQPPVAGGTLQPFGGTARYGDSNYTKWYGNVVIDNRNATWINAFGYDDRPQTGIEFVGNVIINTGGGFYQGSSDNTTYKNNTLINIGTSGGLSGRINVYTNTTGYPSTATIKNNSFVSGVTGIYVSGAGSSAVSRFNNLNGIGTSYSGNVTDKTGDRNLNPSYDTATYGNGAYLMIPTALQGQGESGADIGAEVLYRYQDGVLTNEPLWPWPMEERIFEETGISVTWESNGGLWKTLNGVYRRNGYLYGEVGLM